MDRSSNEIVDIVPSRQQHAAYESYGDNSNFLTDETEQLCARCDLPVDPRVHSYVYDNQVWHPGCFLCAQCFQEFPEGLFFEFEGRRYCQHDFEMLFAPVCFKCGDFVFGRVIKAMGRSWHSECFCCHSCGRKLTDTGFVKNSGRALCRPCNDQIKASGQGKLVCFKCQETIDEGHIHYKGDYYHPYHFNCSSCGQELTKEAREKNGELFCLRCHDRMGIAVCGACRRPIEDRVVSALGKDWHVEHFVCAKCEKPFLGTKYYEKKGLAYCEHHYHQIYGNICYVCNKVIQGDECKYIRPDIHLISHFPKLEYCTIALNKCWCFEHFSCTICDRRLSQKNKFFEVDMKPVCKFCYERFPAELRKRLRKAHDASSDKEQSKKK